MSVTQNPNSVITDITPCFANIKFYCFVIIYIYFEIGQQILSLYCICFFPKVASFDNIYSGKKHSIKNVSSGLYILSCQNLGVTSNSFMHNSQQRPDDKITNWCEFMVASLECGKSNHNFFFKNRLPSRSSQNFIFPKCTASVGFKVA